MIPPRIKVERFATAVQDCNTLGVDVQLDISMRVSSLEGHELSDNLGTDLQHQRGGGGQEP